MIGRSIVARPGWRLTVHFFRALFDFGILTDAGVDSLKHMFLGAVGGFVAFGWVLLRIYVSRYAALWASPSPEPYRRALLGDDLFMIGLPMLLVAFLTVLVSPSLFPDERDFRILGPLPVRRHTVFGAKLTALAIFVGGFIAVVHAALFPLFLLTSRNPWGEHAFASRLVAWMIASLAGSACAMLAITAIAGLVVLACTGGRLHAVSSAARSALLGVLVLGVPMVLRLPMRGGAFADGAWWLWVAPPAWFVGFERLLMGSGSPSLRHWRRLPSRRRLPPPRSWRARTHSSSGTSSAWRCARPSGHVTGAARRGVQARRPRARPIWRFAISRW
jgi:hypothetical protein